MVTVHDRYPEGWPDLFRDRRLHVICVAAGGLSACDFVASTLGGMNQEKVVWPLTHHVNDEGETGTFWPQLPLTVVPQPYWKGLRSGNGLHRVIHASLLRDFYRKSFAEAAAAQRQVGIPDVLLDLNGYGAQYEYHVALEIALDALRGEASVENLWIAPALT